MRYLNSIKMFSDIYNSLGYLCLLELLLRYVKFAQDILWCQPGPAGQCFPAAAAATAAAAAVSCTCCSCYFVQTDISILCLWCLLPNWRLLHSNSVAHYPGCQAECLWLSNSASQAHPIQWPALFLQSQAFTVIVRFSGTCRATKGSIQLEAVEISDWSC